MILETLIVSSVRVKLIRKFFLNPHNEGYLRGLEQELEEPSNSIRLELNRLFEAGLLTTEFRANRRYFKANFRNAYAEDLHRLLRKEIGIPQVEFHLKPQLSKLEAIYLSGNLARGMESSIMDLVLVGDAHRIPLLRRINHLEKLNGRKIRFILFQRRGDAALKKILEEEKPLLLWERNK